MAEVATSGGRISSREPLTGEIVDQGPAPGEPCVWGSRTEEMALASTPDGLRGWIGPNWEVDVSFDEPTYFWWTTQNRVLALTDAFGEHTMVTVLDAKTGEPIGAPLGDGTFFGAEANADGSLFAATFVRPLAPEGAGRIIVIDAESGREVVHIDAPDGATRIAFDPVAWVAFNAGHAGVINLALGEVEVIDLGTGARSSMTLDTPDGDRFRALAVYPEHDGLWAVSLEHFAARWEGGQMVEVLYLGSEPGVVGVRSARSVTGTRLGDLYAVLGQRRDGSQEATLVSFERGASRVLLTVETDDAAAVHPTPEGGMHVVSDDGTVRTYDAAGLLIGSVASGAVEPVVIALDVTTGKLAVDSTSGAVFIIDVTTGRVDQFLGDDPVANLGFARDGSVLVIGLFDGTVRLWDVERAEPAGLIWDGSGALRGEPYWYDEIAESIWVASSGRILQIPMNPDRWIERACEVAGRDLTQDEWDRSVPGDEPFQSACS